MFILSRRAQQFSGWYESLSCVTARPFSVSDMNSQQGSGGGTETWEGAHPSRSPASQWQALLWNYIRVPRVSDRSLSWLNQAGTVRAPATGRQPDQDDNEENTGDADPLSVGARCRRVPLWQERGLSCRRRLQGEARPVRCVGWRERHRPRAAAAGPGAEGACGQNQSPDEGHLHQAEGLQSHRDGPGEREPEAAGGGGGSEEPSPGAGGQRGAAAQRHRRAEGEGGRDAAGEEGDERQDEPPGGDAARRGGRCQERQWCSQHPGTTARVSVLFWVQTESVQRGQR